MFKKSQSKNPISSLNIVMDNKGILLLLLFGEILDSAAPKAGTRWTDQTQRDRNTNIWLEAAI